MKRIAARPVLLMALALGLIWTATVAGRNTDTSLTGNWTGGGHALRLSGSLEGGFSISAGESWTIIGCPITAGQVLTSYAPSGGSSYAATYLWTENENGSCTSSTRGPETVTVAGSATSLTISGCGYALCGSFSRPKQPAPPPTTTSKATTTTTPTTTSAQPTTTKAADTEPPVVTVLGGRGAPGAKIKLTYRVSDNSGKTRDTVTVMRGAQVIAGPRTSPLGRATGNTYWVSWTAPSAASAKGVAYRFCVRARDAAGNGSANRCAPIVIGADGVPPEVYAATKGDTYPATSDTLSFKVTDDSGRSTYHATLYQGGAAVGSSSATVASGRHVWKLRFASDLSGPLYFCVWAEDAAGNRSVGAPASSCAWITFVVPIDRVSNGCGGGVRKWDVDVLAQNYFGNEHRYFDFDTGFTYPVNFAPACDLHDAGYGGHAVKNALRGGKVVDYHGWTRKQVDDQFLADMRLLCNRAIPENAKGALAKCVEGAAYYALPVNHLIGAETLYGFVRKFGDAFFDSNLTKPGLQTAAATPFARDHLPR